MSYDRDYLETAIPEATTDGTDPQGVLSGDEQEKWNDGYEQVLSVVRNEYCPDDDTLTEDQITEAVFLASEAWDIYCEYQGNVDATIKAVRAKLA